MSDMRSPKVTRDSNEAGKHLWRAPQAPGMGEMSHERESLFFHILAFAVICVLDAGHSHGCGKLSHYCIILQFSTDIRC